MTNQQIIEDILSKYSELSRDEILDELAVEKQKTGNLLEEKTLLRLIGARYGLKSNPATTFDGELSISDLIPKIAEACDKIGEKDLVVVSDKPKELIEKLITV